MKVLCIGDIHLGGPGGDERQAERKAIVTHLVDRVIGHGGWAKGINAVVWLGDIFHANSRAADRVWFGRELARLEDEAPDPFRFNLVVRGNHDREHELDIYNLVPETIVATRPGVWHGIGVIPYPTRSLVLAAGGGNPLENVLDALLRHESAPELLVGHLTVTGAIASTGQPQIGHEVELPPAALAPALKDNIPVVLGHIHKPQVIPHTNELVRYVGSICGQDWGELEDKHALLVDTLHVGTDPLFQEVPLPTSKLLRVTGDLKDDGYHPDDKFECGLTNEETERLHDPQYCKGFARPPQLRVRYRFDPVMRDHLDEEQIANWVASLAFEPAAVQVEREPIIGAREIERAEITAGASLHQQAREWLADNPQRSITDEKELDRLLHKVRTVEEEVGV